MQTFLPYASFPNSLRVLDRARLGKQRVEAKQIYLAITDGGAWQHHPAVRMWRGHLTALAVYGAFASLEWIRRGYRDNLLQWFWDRLDCEPLFAADMPAWLGRVDFHASHRSNLLRKNPEHYGRFGWTEPHDLPYVWPK